MVRDVDNTHSSQFDSDNILIFDVETSIYNKGSCFDERNFMVSYVIHSPRGVFFKYHSDPDFTRFICSEFESADVVVGFNVKFDLHWFRWLTGKTFNKRVWDVQLAEFVASGQQFSFDSLDAACERYGLPRKPDLVKEYWKKGISTEHVPINMLEEYNIHDVVSTYNLYQLQQQLLDDKQKTLVYLEGEDLKTLQVAEYAGMKFDVSQASITVSALRDEVVSIKESLKEFIPSDATDFNWNSGNQLSALLYGGTITYDYAISEPAVYKSGAKLGQSYTKNTQHTKPVSFLGYFTAHPDKEVAKTKADPTAKVRFYQTDAPTLLSLKAKTREQKDLLDKLFSLSGKSKACEMIESLLKINEEQNWNGFLHGQFNQNVAVTGRLSSSRPNLQNTDENIDNLLVSRYDS